MFKSHNLSKDTKLRAFGTLVMPVSLYGAKTCNVSNNDLRKLIEDVPNGSLHDILGVILWGRMWNTTILEKRGELPMVDQLRQRRLW